MVLETEGYMIKVILWDMDGTILDFKAAERNAIRKCFEKFQLGECTDEMILEYSALNDNYWKRLELGEITKSRLLVQRFEEFLSSYYLDASIAADFNKEYQLRLGDTICFLDHAYELIQSLQGCVKQYIVTNGALVAQKRKLERSNLLPLIDGVFISDEIGYEKPAKEFFDYVLQHIGTYAKDEILIVGDSLTSDMLGGILAGIQCCWYNPEGKENIDNLPIHYTIQNLNRIRELL